MRYTKPLNHKIVIFGWAKARSVRFYQEQLLSGNGRLLNTLIATLNE